VNVSARAATTRLNDFLESRADRYQNDRNFPYIDGTSGLSADLRAGTIGIRTCVETAFKRRATLHGRARESLDVWISELIWRDFYQMIYRRFPHVASEAFHPKANGIEWNAPDAAFAAWCAGQTGYPIIDAAMRQLNAQGWMHNRLRMLAASFLTKHLLIDWRLGALYFEQHLIDADPAQNNGGWQWAASTGTDAAPYFRIFNPTVQSKRFDPNGAFIKRYVRELQPVPERYIHEPCKMPAQLQRDLGIAIGSDYPAPIVEHNAARTHALSVFGGALNR
jgi:deoxyribodipyrimidine photo-lyase